ncbi:polysaccharide deacetylase [Canicola haemoglobinophilus]|uniref:Polysaccharide deacetylase n=2 Tax=Canicola haemoglobinophilus TaxID=733 RepID=A0A377HTQ9_9PAST|nr:polysaccharide deacetylase [Canicola haemoglobinophilus]
MMSVLRLKSAVKIGFIFAGLSCLASSIYAQNKLAIVIDDIGYRPKEDSQIYALPKEVSVAIIPSAPHARQRDQLAKQQNRDILIHLPMQPLNQQKIEDGGLKLGMSQPEVYQRVKVAQHILPNAIGMNNHMGSAATADKDLMHKLMTALSQQHLFFLDSRTIGRSVAGKTAKEFGISTLERDIFIDDNDELSDVQRQWNAAIQHARKKGSAIVIGHPRKNTIAVLQAGIKQLPQDIQLVGMGSLWRNEKIIPRKPFLYLFSDIPAPTSQSPFQTIPLLRGVPSDI